MRIRRQNLTNITINQSNFLCPVKQLKNTQLALCTDKGEEARAAPPHLAHITGYRYRSSKTHNQSCSRALGAKFCIKGPNLASSEKGAVLTIL